LQKPFAEVGSLYPHRENFRLTQKAMEKFTVVRVYSEPSSKNGLEKLSAVAKQWIFE
jgi:hypothetical protein